MTRHTSFTIAQGQAFQCEADIFTIAWCDENNVHLRHGVSGEVRTISASALVAEYVERRMIPLNDVEYELAKQNGALTLSLDFSPPNSDLSEATNRRARSVLFYIEQLRRLGYTCLRPTPLLKMDFSKLKNAVSDREEPPEDLTLATVYAYSLRIQRANGDSRAAFPNFAMRGGRGECRLSAETRNAISQKLEELRNSDSRISFSAIHEDVRNLIQAQRSSIDVFKDIPSLATVTRLTKAEFNPYEIAVRNRGRAYADKQFRSWHPRDRSGVPLSVVEFDDKDSRVFLIDDATGLPYGRAFVTAGVDQFSSMPLGLSIGTEHRNTQSALETFRDCLLPKHGLVSKFGLPADVAGFFGSPGVAVFDNALYNHARDLESAINETSQSIIAWAKPHTPTEKSIIEDFNGRCVGAFQELPGFGGPKNQKDQLSEALLSSSMTLQDFKNYLYHWVFRVYCNSPRAEGLTPMQLWHKHMRTTKPRYPINLDKFDAAFASTKSCLLRPGGIQHNKLIYQSDRLVALRRTMGSEFRVTFRVPFNTLERIFVLDPRTSMYFVVPSSNPEYTKGLTAYQHKQIRKLAAENRTKNPSFLDLVAAKDELQNLVAQLRHSKKRHERRVAMHLANGESWGAAASTKQPQMEIVTDLEHQLDELAMVELDDSDEDWELEVSF